MALTLACRDVGVDCPYVARGETEEELMANILKHGKEVHGYTDEQLTEPQMIKKSQGSNQERVASIL